MPKLFTSLGHHFPELESLEFFAPYCQGCDYELILLDALCSVSAPRLRQLTLREVEPRCLSPLLSSTTGLVELTLTLRVTPSTLSEASLIADLQRMSCLRRLELKLSYVNRTTIGDGRRGPAGAGDIVPLPKLMQLVFTGYAIYLEALLVVLAAPSLQYLEAKLSGETESLPIPHLCRFICDTNSQFNRVRVGFSELGLTFAAGTCSGSVHAEPFVIAHDGDISLEEMGNKLSGPLSTVEELVFAWDDFEPLITQRVQWCRFFDHVQQVKSVRVPSEVALDVAQLFQLDGQEPAVDLLPALEQVKVQMTHRPPIGSGDQYTPIRDAFEPIIAARKQMGRHIILSWE